MIETVGGGRHDEGDGVDYSVVIAAGAGRDFECFWSQHLRGARRPQ
ncbi:hypothetical protein [Streptomyces flaveolus]